MQKLSKNQKTVLGKINPRYDMKTSQIDEIYKNSRDPFDMICRGFRLGYLQGMKAAKAEMRGNVVNG